MIKPTAMVTAAAVAFTPIAASAAETAVMGGAGGTRPKMMSGRWAARLRSPGRRQRAVDDRSGRAPQWGPGAFLQQAGLHQSHLRQF